MNHILSRESWFYDVNHLVPLCLISCSFTFPKLLASLLNQFWRGQEVHWFYPVILFLNCVALENRVVQQHRGVKQLQQSVNKHGTRFNMMNTKISLNKACQNFKYFIPLQQFIPPWDRSSPVEAAVFLSKGEGWDKTLDLTSLWLTGEVSLLTSYLGPVEVEIQSSILMRILQDKS